MAAKRKAEKIVRLTITLKYAEPKVIRRMDVAANSLLEDLHTYIQIAMGWEDCHLWGFGARRRGERRHWSDEDYPATLRQIMNFLDGNNTCEYTYDFGDSWVHAITIGPIKDARPDRTYPYLLSGTGRCPPEEIGGLYGFDQLKAAFDDPESEYREYYPGYFKEGVERIDFEDAQLADKIERLESYKSEC